MIGTVTVYNGLMSYNITGKIVREYHNGFTVEDRNGCRWTAYGDRATRNAVDHEPQRTDKGSAYLW